MRAADVLPRNRQRCWPRTSTVPGRHWLLPSGFRTSILEFLACRPGERIGGAILIYQSQTGGATGFGGEMVRRALGQAKPGQILLAENISQRIREVPGIEIRTVPALTTVTADEQTGLTELVWTTPDRIALVQVSVGDDAEPQTGDIPPVGATVIVHSPFAGRGPVDEAMPATGTGEVVRKDGSETGSRQLIPVANHAQDRSPVFEELRESTGGSLAEGLEEFGAQPLITRSRVILGAVALVLVAALIAVLYRPAHVSNLPIPPQQERTGATEIPDKQLPAKAEPQAMTAQPEPEIVKPQVVKTQIAKPRAKVPVAMAQPQTPSKPLADNRVKNQQNVPESPAPYFEESGGVSQKDIPTLLKMAQTDAGAGNYDKARTEFRKILGLQPGNQDAREGLHKLDIIQKDQ